MAFAAGGEVVAVGAARASDETEAGSATGEVGASGGSFLSEKEPRARERSA